jgi:hypothetical protein
LTPWLKKEFGEREGLLTSHRDGQPYEILWGVDIFRAPPEDPAPVVVAYELTHGYFPTAGAGPWQHRSLASDGVPKLGRDQNWGWGYQILPYLEQENLWGSHDENEVLRTPVRAYFCPSRRPPMIVTSHWGTRAMMDYGL